MIFYEKKSAEAAGPAPAEAETTDQSAPGESDPGTTAEQGTKSTLDATDSVDKEDMEDLFGFESESSRSGVSQIAAEPISEADLKAALFGSGSEDEEGNAWDPAEVSRGRGTGSHPSHKESPARGDNDATDETPLTPDDAEPVPGGEGGHPSGKHTNAEEE